jgi:hypothetical protein
MKGAFVAALLLAAGNAQAGALAECAAMAFPQTDLMGCLRAAQRQASSQMLDSFLTVEQALRKHESDTARERSLAVLRQSQRDFERYLQAHCQLAQRLAIGAAAAPAAAACEVDQLRARAAALELLAAGKSN